MVPRTEARVPFMNAPFSAANRRTVQPSPPAAAPGPKAVRLTEPPAKPIRLCLADDDGPTRRAITSHSRRRTRPIEVTQVSSTDALCRTLRQDSFDMVMVDLSLPNLERVARIRHQEPGGTLVGLTDEIGARERDLARVLGGFDLLQKPVTEDALDRALGVHDQLSEKLRILVVDGSAPVRKVIRKVLHRSCFNTAPDDLDSDAGALDRLRADRFDFVFFGFSAEDLDLPARIARMRQAAPDTRLVLMSVEERAAVAAWLTPDVMDGYLKKPFFPQDLDAVIRNLREVPEPVFL